MSIAVALREALSYVRNSAPDCADKDFKLRETNRMDGGSLRKTVVSKLGGSVLVDADSYGQASRFIVRRLHRRPEERLVVVVSAQKGHTDELEELARGITNHPNPRTLDLLWSTGEMRSVALLTLHLEKHGVAAIGLNAHETGLRLNGSAHADAGIDSLSGELRNAFHYHSVVVVPGFFGTLTSGTLVSLGRGGSDLSAVLLARDLEAEQCELIKDVSGYFTEDPNVNGQAEYLARLSYEQALDMADAGCELVHPGAIRAARAAGLHLVVRSLDDAAPVSIVSGDGRATERSPYGEASKKVR
ncbi:MAG TPA: hypothetical protein VFN26_19865 [Candidatus Acidoferrum sp.]|nr:hypothetical protein [Candidatus Acidoferrum sp.]